MKTHHQVIIFGHINVMVFLKKSVNKVNSQVGMFGLMTLINACKKRKLLCHCYRHITSLSYVKTKNKILFQVKAWLGKKSSTGLEISYTL
jgi:hypothetical protein